jgi:hypothetical protein
MDKSFWQNIVNADFAVPDGQTVASLTPELLDFLGSTDIEVRDPFGYTVLAHWIVRDGHYSPDDLRAMRDQLIANLDQGIGENGTDSVFLRSFSVLILSLIVYRDNLHPFLTESEIADLLDHTLRYFAAEQDLRGFLVETGWAHTVAHTADTLKFLARNLKTTREQHKRILNAIADKLLLPVTYVYIHSEDERLVSAVIDVLKRQMLSIDEWQAWLDRFTAWKNSWQPGDFVPTIHAPWWNAKNFLRSLYFRLDSVANLPANELKPKIAEVLKVYGQ